MRALRIALAATFAAVAVAVATSATADTGPKPTPGETRPAILVGNNWDGTTDILDPYTFERLDRINVVPDKEERLAEINSSPDKLGYFLAIREQVGEGHDQFNDDVFSSHDGRRLFVSRPSFADVVGIDLATKKIAWRATVAGYRSDHMAISPDGTRLLVSASTGNVVHQIDTATGKITGFFPSGDSPHENNYSKDGKLVYHASIGRVYTPTDQSPIETDTSKGKRVFQVVDGESLKILKTWDMGKKLEEAGHPGMSSAVRPMALSPDEKTLFFQVSFFHGVVEFDLAQEKVVRIAEFPISEEAAKLRREDYLLDSAHHGLAINKSGDKLCVAGTMSDYGAIVNRETLKAKLVDAGKKPYWATNSADGRSCYMSASGDDQLTVISYDSEEIVKKVAVGDHPQRVRNGVVRLEQYPGGPYGEKFTLAVTTARALTVKNGRTSVACRAAGAKELRLTRCLVRVVTASGAEIAKGERVADAAAFNVSAALTPKGRALLKRRPNGIRAMLTVRGTDSVGRTRTVRKRVVLRRR
jgi:DNA-binding beta-propeller fold protein YncE